MTASLLREMILHGWPVMLVLLIMSIASLTVLVDRLSAFRSARHNIRGFVANVVRVLDSHGIEHARTLCVRYPYPIAHVVTAILSAAPTRDARQRAGQHALEEQVHLLESFVPVLGTIAGTAPFVGLFGTVMGIIKAFMNIAATGSGGAQVVSAGISEALITTAFGLLVAVPAIIAYNYCLRFLQRLTQQVELAVFDLYEKLEQLGDGASDPERFKLQ